MGEKPAQKSYQFPKTASKAQVVRNLNTAVRKAGYTFDYDSGDYGDFAVHLGKTWIGGSIITGILRSIYIRDRFAHEVAALRSVQHLPSTSLSGYCKIAGPAGSQRTMNLDERIKSLDASFSSTFEKATEVDNISIIINKHIVQASVQLPPLTNKFVISRSLVRFRAGGSRIISGVE
jgi:hypothetical protein